MAARQRTQGDQHPETLTSINNLASCYKAVGQFDRAEPLYISALEWRREVLGNRHPDTLTSINNLASLYQSLGSQGYGDIPTLEKAEPLLKEALIGAKRELGADHPHALIFARNLAQLHDKCQQVRERGIETTGYADGVQLSQFGTLAASKWRTARSRLTSGGLEK